MNGLLDNFEIVIVTFNSQAEITRLLADIKKWSLSALGRTIVIDNASVDRTTALVKELFPIVNLKKNKKNYGYSRAVNQGIALCKKKYVFLINPDIRIKDRLFWKKMLILVNQNKTIAAIGPLQYKDLKKKQLNFTWSYWSLKGLKLYFLQCFFKNKSLNNKPIKTTFLNCGCLLLSRSAFERVGKLNEKYFLYGEEPDLFFKLKRFGYLCYLYPKAWVVHFREKSIKRASFAKQIYFKLMAVKNISDALFRGIIKSSKHSSPIPS